MAPPGDAVLAFASAFPLLLLGAILLLIRPRRPSQLFFGGFAVLWSLQIVAANLGRVLVDSGFHAVSLRASFIFLAPASLFLVHFALRFRPNRMKIIVTAVYGLIAAATAVVLAIAPDQIVVGARLVEGRIVADYGPLLTPLITYPFFGAFIIAILSLYREMRRARPGTTRRRYRGLLMALALYASYQFMFLAAAFFPSDGLATFATSGVTFTSWMDTVGLTLFFTGGAALLLVLAFHAVLRPPPPEDGDLALGLAFLFPGAIGLLEVILGSYDIPMETLGFWRFVSVGVVVYTLANHQLFDLDLKMKRFAGPGVAGLLGLFGVPLAITLALGDVGGEAILLTLIPEVIGIGAVLVFHNRVEEALFPGVEDTPGYVHQRKLELYKVALEDKISRGGDLDDPDLSELRDRFGIKMDEHNVLVWLLGHGSDPGSKKETMTGPVGTGTLVLDRYRLDGILGQGTHRTTYRAVDEVSRSPVAVKVAERKSLDGAAAHLLLRDARIGASISHPNVLAIYDATEVGDHAFVVMDYADQGNLDDLIRKRGALSLPQALHFLDGLLAGLEAIHERGVIHRNLKPKNILIDRDGTTIVADFSAAATTGKRSRTQTDVEEETLSAALQDPLYLAPEQIEGEDAVPASDLYVSAALFYYAFTGRFYLPIAGKSDFQIHRVIRTQEPQLDALDGAPAALRDTIKKAFAKSVDARHADAASFRAAIAPLIEAR